MTSPRHEDQNICRDVKQIAPVGAEIIFRKSQEISSIYLNPLQSYKQINGPGV